MDGPKFHGQMLSSLGLVEISRRLATGASPLPNSPQCPGSGGFAVGLRAANLGGILSCTKRSLSSWSTSRESPTIDLTSYHSLCVPVISHFPHVLSEIREGFPGNAALGSPAIFLR